MNDAVRFLIDRFIGVAVLFFRVVLFFRMKSYSWNQARLRRTYSISNETPVLGYDGQRFTVKDGVLACTSGSTKEPKRVPYDRRRLSLTQLVFIDSFWRYLAETPLINRSIFIFSSMRRDDSLTSLLLQDPSPPPYLFGLQAPHLVQNDSTVLEAARIYGETAVRLWILAVSNPALIYATNPSTIAAFFHEVHENWESSRRLIVEAKGLERIQKRIAVRGAAERLRRIAASRRPLPISEMFPALGAFACWDGGYVAPFIEQVRRYLPVARYQHLPMYSMSTETIETIAVSRNGKPRFLPLAPGVFYEFVEEGKADLPVNLLLPAQLKPGKHYAMVVSDAYGLRRYQTDDLFECVGMIDGIPDLRFAQRRNLSYSFTGEKLTAEQLKLAYVHVASCFPTLHEDGFLTCFPCIDPVPRYQLMYVTLNSPPNLGGVHLNLAALVHEKLCELNSEYQSKVESGRLSAMKFETISLQDFMQHVRGPESQFKFLPLYTKLWKTHTTSMASAS